MPGAKVKIRPGLAADAEGILEVHRRSILELGRVAYSKAECASWAAGLIPVGYVEAMTSGGEKSHRSPPRT